MARAALLVAACALLEAVLSPFLTFGWVGPKFVVIGIVVAVVMQRELQALLLGFFGGILTDALGGGIFGVGALGGVAAAMISLRVGAGRRKKAEMRLALTVASALSVVAYDVAGLLALVLSGDGGPPLGGYVVAGVVPDALLNAVLAYLVVGSLLGLMVGKEEGREV